MKAKLLLAGLILTLTNIQLFAQGESDDMYFNAKDREKLKSAITEDTYKPRKKTKNEVSIVEPEQTINPTDSYSSRNINPEYISRANSSQAEADQNYFVEGYTSKALSSNNSNTYYNNPYSNNYYNNSTYANRWGSPMYDPFYNGYGYYNPWMSPYSNFGSSLSLSYYWGNSWGNWNYGMGYGSQYYSPYCNPYSYNYYPSYYSPYYSYGYPTYYYSSHEKSTRTYMKRPSLVSAGVTPIQQRTRSTSSVTSTPRGRVDRSSSDEYYVKPSRRMSSFDGTSNNSMGSFQRNSSSSFSRTRSFDNSNRSFSSPSRSNNSMSSPSRSFSSPSHSGGGGGGSRPRGRN